MRTEQTLRRKQTASFYTPLVLVDCLLGETLEPLIAEALKADRPEQALLELTTCDPACGSGVFLVTAARRIADTLATHRDAEEPPIGQATREVVENLIHGVDLNPLAVDLTRLVLSAEAMLFDTPNPDLTQRIKHGNSLLGTTPKLLAEGIPDDAFKPLPGDDPKAAAEMKKRNRSEREQWQMSGIDLAALPPDRQKLLADAWCGAFVQPKTMADLPTAITNGTLLHIATGRPAATGRPEQLDLLGDAS